MLEGSRPATRGDHAILAADGFLFAAAIDCVSSAVMVGTSANVGETWGAVLSIATVLVTVFGGALLAWRLHGRSFGWIQATAMLGGALIGSALALPALVAGWQVLRRVTAMVFGPVAEGVPQTGPWLEIGVLAAIALLVMLGPVIDATRDAVRERRHVRLDLARGAAAIAVVAIAGVIMPWIGAVQGSEAGEMGIFMLPFAAAGALAVVSADLADTWRARRAVHGGVPQP